MTFISLTVISWSKFSNKPFTWNLAWMFSNIYCLLCLVVSDVDQFSVSSNFEDWSFSCNFFLSGFCCINFFLGVLFSVFLSVFVVLDGWCWTKIIVSCERNGSPLMLQTSYQIILGYSLSWWPCFNWKLMVTKNFLSCSYLSINNKLDLIMFYFSWLSSQFTSVLFWFIFFAHNLLMSFCWTFIFL